VRDGPKPSFKQGLAFWGVVAVHAWADGAGCMSSRDGRHNKPKCGGDVAGGGTRDGNARRGLWPSSSRSRVVQMAASRAEGRGWGVVDCLWVGSERESSCGVPACLRASFVGEEGDGEWWMIASVHTKDTQVRRTKSRSNFLGVEKKKQADTTRASLKTTTPKKKERGVREFL